jgi:hypothetical protein
MLEDNQKSNKSNDWKEREMGAFWTKDGSKGKYLSGTVEVGEAGNKEKIQVVMFPNQYKETDRQPDYILYKSKEIDANASSSAKVKKEEIPESLV